MKQHDFIWDKQTPQLPCIIHVLDIGTKGIKNVYFSTMESVYNIIKQVQEKWAKHFNEDISFDTVTSGFKNIKKVAPSVYQQFNHLKLLHRLFKMEISENLKLPFLQSHSRIN